MNLLENVEATVLYRGSTALAATNVDSTTVLDMAGFDGCMLITTIIETTAGASTTAVKLTARHSTGSASTSLTDLGSTSIAGDASISTSDWGKALIVDVYKPTKRYLGVSIDKDGAGTSMTSAVVALQYAGMKVPTSQPSGSVYASKQLVSPTT